MNEIIIYISGNKLNVINDNKSFELSSQAYLRYIKNTNEIKDKNKWKYTGSGAVFMGQFDPSMFDDEDSFFNISGISASDKINNFIYSTILNDFTGIYFKDYAGDKHTEKLIYSDKDLAIKDINYKNNKILASVSQEDTQFHIALFDLDVPGYVFLSDGDTIDENPSFSKMNPNIIYYNCRGIGRDNNGNVAGYSPRHICKLNTLEGSVDEMLISENFEYIKPKEDYNGNLYYIKLPFKDKTRHSIKISDILLAPFRLLKAIIGFLDIFTKKYSGQSLKSSGSNPAKTKAKSDKDIFIEGNLINVEKTLKENQSSGDKYPGFAPKNWELRRLDRDGTDVCVKKGILDYDITQDGNIIYSNGHYIMELDTSSEETFIAKANLVTKIIVTSEN